jgi:hypothetical protein
MRADSTDLHQWVVAASDGTLDEIAARFSVGVPWFRNRLRGPLRADDATLADPAGRSA